MNPTLAAEHLGQILEVDEVRYPTNIRMMHLSEANQFLAREYDVRMNEGMVQIEIPSNGRYSLETVIYQGLRVEYVTSVWTFTEYEASLTDPTNPNLLVPTKLYELACAPQIEDFTRRYADTEAWADYVPDDGPPTPPFAYTEYGSTLIFAPLPTETVYARIFFRGIPPDQTLIGLSEPFWFRIAPWPIIYRAAEIACVWLEDEERIPVYERMRREHMDAINITDSMRNDVPLESTEA